MSDNQYYITNVFNENQPLYVTGGKAGKLYLQVPGPVTSAPLQLREVKFNYQQTRDGKIIYANNDASNIKPVFIQTDPTSPNTRYTIDLQSNLLPSPAEVLFYMITRRIDEKLMPNEDMSCLDEMLNLFVHRYRASKNDENRAYYVSKQFDWVETSHNSGQFVLIVGNKTFTQD